MTVARRIDPTARPAGAAERKRGLANVPRAVPPPAPGLLGALDTCELAGISYRQIDYWCRAFEGRMPIAVDAHGSGSQRWFRRSDIPKLHVLGKLARLGLPIGEAFELTHQQRLRLVNVMAKMYDNR
jgi:hypothetical protein